MDIPKSVASVSVIECGAMSRDVYRGEEEPLDPLLLACSWERVSTFHKSDSMGFRARLYRRSEDGVYLLAYRGTELTKKNNYEADFLLANKKSSVFLYYAQDIYNTVCSQYAPPIIMTGHSLGGYLAQYMAIFSWLKKPDSYFPYAVVFNAPHVGDLFPEDSYEFILNIQMGGDKIHKVGKRVGVEYFLPAAPRHPLNSFSPMDIVRAITPFSGKQILASKLLAYGIYLKGEHEMDTIMQKLIELSEEKEEILGFKRAPLS